jgi:hypothetical protein
LNSSAAAAAGAAGAASPGGLVAPQTQPQEREAPRHKRHRRNPASAPLPFAFVSLLDDEQPPAAAPVPRAAGAAAAAASDVMVISDSE